MNKIYYRNIINDGKGNASMMKQKKESSSSVVQINFATAEESTVASEELAGQAQMLQHLTSKFQLKATEL